MSYDLWKTRSDRDEPNQDHGRPWSFNDPEYRTADSFDRERSGKPQPNFCRTCGEMMINQATEEHCTTCLRLYFQTCVRCGGPFQDSKVSPERHARRECWPCFNDMQEKEKRMSTVASDSGGGDFQPAPAGTHVARCIQVVDLGTQPGSPQYPKWKHKVRLVWELCHELAQTDDGEKPMLIGQDYTLSLHENAVLRAHLEAWRGRQFTEDELRAFDIKNVMGHPCMLTLVHRKSAKGRTYANVTAVAGLPKGTTVPEQIHPSLHYEIEMREAGTWADLPEWMQDKIKGSEEWGRDEPPQDDRTWTGDDAGAPPF